MSEMQLGLDGTEIPEPYRQLRDLTPIGDINSRLQRDNLRTAARFHLSWLQPDAVVHPSFYAEISRSLAGRRPFCKLQQSELTVMFDTFGRSENDRVIDYVRSLGVHVAGRLVQFELQFPSERVVDEHTLPIEAQVIELADARVNTPVVID